MTGVRQISVLGGDTANFTVELNPTAMLTRGVTVQDVQDALSKTNVITSVGAYNQSYLRHQVLVSGLLESSADISRVTVAVKNRVPVTIGEVGEVRRGIETATIATSGDGRPAVLLNVIKQPDGNTIQVAQGIAQALADAKTSLPPGVHLSTFYDQSQISQEAQASVVEAIVVGGLLALVVLMLFLGNLRTAAVVLLILPVTLLITFGLMKALGQTMNIMTLGALAIALGLVIDDGIVVVENMFHALESGRPKRDAIAEGLKAITPAMIGSSLTTMAAFLPLTFLSGVTGQFFGPLALVMIATLGVSLVMALFLTPLLAEFLLPSKVTKPERPPGPLLRLLPRPVRPRRHTATGDCFRSACAAAGSSCCCFCPSPWARTGCSANSRPASSPSSTRAASSWTTNCPPGRPWPKPMPPAGRWRPSSPRRPRSPPGPAAPAHSSAST